MRQHKSLHLVCMHTVVAWSDKLCLGEYGTKMHEGKIVSWHGQFDALGSVLLGNHWLQHTVHVNVTLMLLFASSYLKNTVAVVSCSKIMPPATLQNGSGMVEVT